MLGKILNNSVINPILDPFVQRSREKKRHSHLTSKVSDQANTLSNTFPRTASPKRMAKVTVGLLGFVIAACLIAQIPPHPCVYAK